MAKKKISEILQDHLVNTTALVTVVNPLLAVIETSALRMEDDVSLLTRLSSTGTAYAGIGWVLSKGRDVYRNFAGITDETDEKKQKRHDRGYFGLTSIPLSLALYSLSGETDIRKILGGTALAFVISYFSGSFSGRAIDYYRDMLGMEECNRESYPRYVKKMRPGLKKGLAVTLTAASIGVVAAVYSATPDKLDLDRYKFWDMQNSEKIYEK